jgi:membrane protease YdiL (CAAX protease family)
LNHDIWAVAVAIALPTLVTQLYFVWLAHAGAAKQLAYGVGKTAQFALPAAWVLAVRGEPLELSLPDGRGLALGVGFGLLVAAAMAALYWLWLKPAGLFAGRVQEEMIDKLRGFGLTRVWRYAALGVFYALGHSLLEEYYWRWFVFGRLAGFAPLSVAIAVSSLGFMAHHVILLVVYFGWRSPATWLFSIAVAVGGAIWAWLYADSGSLAGPWLSHLLVDAAIFVVGYDVARRAFGPPG